jgi:two-component system cell cycle response regulator DivK
MAKRILIIEDNPDERLLEREILKGAGYEVLEADNAKDGVSLALKERPDLILMDIRLPYKAKGIGAARILRDKKETADTPIIFLTAYATFEHKRSVDNIPNSGFLAKSADPQELVRHVERFLK